MTIKDKKAQARKLLRLQARRSTLEYQLGQLNQEFKREARVLLDAERVWGNLAPAQVLTLANQVIGRAA